MSALLSLTQDAANMLASAPATLPTAGGGITDWLGSKNTDIASLARAVSLTLGVCFVIYHGLVSRGSLARIVTAGIAAAVFCWIVFNVTDLKTRVDNEINSSPVSTQILR